MPDKLRENLQGFSFEQDRLWRITGPNFVVGLTEYNDEITGFAPLLRGLFPNSVQYGGNANYVLNKCRERKYQVEAVEDRK